MSETNLNALPGIGGKTEALLRDAGFDNVTAIAGASVDDLSAVKGFGPARAQRLIDSAKEILAASETPATPETAAQPDAKADREPAATVTPITAAKPARKPLPVAKIALGAAAALVVAIVGLGMADQEPFRDYVGVKQIKSIFAEEVNRSDTTAAVASSSENTTIAKPDAADDAQAGIDASAETNAGAETVQQATQQAVQAFTQGAQAMANPQPMPFAGYPMPRYGMPPAPFQAAHQNEGQPAADAPSGADQSAETDTSPADAGAAQVAQQPMAPQGWRPVYPGNWSQGAGNGNFSGSFGFSTRQRFHGNGLHRPAWGYAPYPYGYGPAYPRAQWQPTAGLSKETEKAGG